MRRPALVAVVVAAVVLVVVAVWAGPAFSRMGQPVGPAVRDGIEVVSTIPAPPAS